jgi:hypothetical protein
MYLVNAVRDLAAHGPAKPEAEHGLDEVKEEYEGAQVLRCCSSCSHIALFTIELSGSSRKL